MGGTAAILRVTTAGRVEDTVWEKSDVDLVLVTIDDKKVDARRRIPDGFSRVT